VNRTPPVPQQTTPPAKAPGQGSSLLPSPSAILELVVIVALILLVAGALPDIDLADIHPNPLWLPVLLLSLQYGTVSGLMAAVAAILVTVYLGFPEEGVGENYFSYVLRNWSQPILWLATAVLLGQFRQRQISEREELTRRLGEMAEQRAHLADYGMRLRQRCERLERSRAAEPSTPTVALLGALSALSQPAGELALSFRRCISLAFPGAAASVYALQPTGLERLADCGWAADAPWQTRLEPSHVLYRAIVAEAAPLNVAITGDESRLAGEGLAAVPIRAAGDGRVIGILKLEMAPAVSITPDTTIALEVLAFALAQRLAPAALGVPVLPTRPAAQPAQGGRLFRLLRRLPSRPREDGPSRDSTRQRIVS